MSDKPTPTLIFTGGHHTSALAVAQGLQQSGWNIIWIGHRHSLWGDSSDSAEYSDVTRSGIRFYDLQAGKLYRTFHPQRLIRLPWGFIQAMIILIRLKIEFGSALRGIVTFGGYLGVPVVVSGRLIGLSSLAHEQTVTAGWANKIISRFAKKIAISWPSSQHHYPAEKVVLTGLPFRPEITRMKIQKPGRRHDLIYVTGGKQGSHALNSAVFAALPQLLPKFIVVHQTGSSSVYADYSQALELKSGFPETQTGRYQVYQHVSAADAAKYLATATVVISRAGAHITQELALFGTKSVLVPIPWSSHSEQLYNAQVLARADLAVILDQDQLDGTSLVSAVDRAVRLAPRQVDLVTDGLNNFISLVNSTFSKS